MTLDRRDETEYEQKSRNGSEQDPKAAAPCRSEQKKAQPDLPAVMIGHSYQANRLRRMVNHLAGLDSHVLILAETGTHPEEVAHYLHSRSPRAGEPLVEIGCRAMPPGLLGRRLFGERRVVFNDAFWDRAGQLEEHEHAAVVLVGVEDLSQELQTKLLHFCKTREFVRFGGEEIRHSDARIFFIAGSGLRRRVEEGAFRDDLYFLLQGRSLRLPPLRERPEDLPLIISHMVRQWSGQSEGPFPIFERAAIEALRLNTWPGNLQELESVIREAMIVSGSRTIRLEHLPDPYGSPQNVNLLTLEENERRHIERVLRHTGFNKSRAAKILRISRPTLNSKIFRYGLLNERPASGTSEVA